MKIETKVVPKAGATSPEPRLIKRTNPPTGKLISACVQEIVSEAEDALDRVIRLPFPIGETGQVLLDMLERLDKFRDVIRDRARAVLDQSPNAIPGWHLETAVIKKLVRDKGRSE